MMMMMIISKKVVFLNSMIILLLLTNVANCDVQQDKQRCETPVLGMATCLPYVTGQARLPPVDCCSGFNQVLENNPDCICLLIKDRNDPSLGLNINSTLALTLPARCKSTANRTIADCPAILHLPPNSTEAKVFQDFTNSGNETNAMPPASSGNSTTTMAGNVNSQNGGGRGRRMAWLGTEVVSIMLVALHLFFANFNFRVIN
ncbi:non-specific lipid transfer protein GPI-anchored 13-like [Andrographis paniculata]|uniref:non-specific lipid transfer protein GPI-anchored 13-like n=1 Tax=Andrographis paniculata TaxID=175694 RepID=UPI0021E79E6B|nr:non-specific lipid transfer protein GPI-anchored 13-like [Andrographis paniculata]